MKFYLSVLITVFCVCRRFVKAEQTYTVTNERFEHYEGQQNTLFNHNMKVIGRQRSLNGTMTFLEDFDNNRFMLQVELYSAQNGDDNFKLLPTGLPPNNFCETLKNYFNQMLKPSLVEGENTNFPNIPEEGLCPLPKGEYYFKELILNTDSWPSQIPRGTLKSKMIFYKDGKNIGAWSLQMKIEDRK
ncbi:uncharacterized protein LOC105210754 [Zeugodacus cucurbitae]|uniref:Ribosome maturation factor RimM n=1 Tax=Zeugodacus cucurbitae TaxID=28588 RepID=A0A0A1WZK4_ZEUCU|nr:uncharacterized protein LOC105210754 [Zeugodacus cucurbitae]